MKNLLKIAVLVMAVAGLTACVKDLNTKPIDPNSSTSFNQERMFTKCYSCLALIGQSSPKEDSDVEDIDAGTSGFYRTIWYCNELSSDEAWWIWDDKEAVQLNSTNWNGTNTMIRAIYTRLVLDIKYCNHYLTYASEESQEEKYRKAEVRFIRALHYFYLLDMYLYAPFLTEDSNEFPHFKPRHEIYQWLVEELRDLTIVLPDHRLNKYRVGKAAAKLLLARVYLNADVYNKYNKSWTEKSALDNAIKYADAAISDDGQHGLVTAPIVSDSGFVYTAYQRLFMGDNDREDVVKESLLQIYQDGLYAQSYATSMMLIGANRIQGMIPWGIESEWHSMRTSPTLIDKFLKVKNIQNIDRETAKAMRYDEYHMPAQLKDDRAIFCSDGLNTGKQFSLSGPMELGDTKYLFDCWAGLKFTGVYSTASLPKYSPRQSKDWPDTDIPLLRIAEAYMIRGEAKARKSGNWNDAIADVNVLRDRANAPLLASMDEETMLDEWCREFWYEGRRRIDLVRFGRFFGKEADQYRYHWEGRMGNTDSKPYVTGTEDYMNWFPIPSEDKRSNPNFAKDVEGDPENSFAAQGGDGYPY